jgi:hypothetical protein
MRSPTKPLFKLYDILAVVAFLASAAVITGLKLVY